MKKVIKKVMDTQIGFVYTIKKEENMCDNVSLEYYLIGYGLTIQQAERVSKLIEKYLKSNRKKLGA